MARRKKTIEDVICAIQEALDIAEEIKDGEPEDNGTRQTAIDAINMIRRGAYDDAITTLEREFLPYWEDVADCDAAYRKAMGR